MRKGIIFYSVCQVCVLCSFGQVTVDSAYIRNYELPNVIRISLEKTGAGLEISPDNSLVTPTASFPFNTGTNLGLYLSYKFLNLSVSQSLHQKTNNKSLVVALNTTSGASTFGGKFGFYNNVAAVQDKKSIRVRSSINLFKFSPYWLVNTNYHKFSLAATADHSQLQRRSAGAFMFEINPFFLQASGKNGTIIPSGDTYKFIFEEMAGLQRLTIVNLDFRPGYMYTKVFEEGTWCISGGLFLGPGFGYHRASAETSTTSGLHWQSSLRMNGSVVYNADRYFIAGSFRYTNSFTPVSSLGILADEGLLMITFGLRFNALEHRIPETWRGLLGKPRK
jgi:hypothetical protein